MPETPSSVGVTVKKNKTMFMVLGAGALGVLAYAWWKAGTKGQPGATATDFQGTPQDQFIPPYQQYQTSGAVDLSQLPPIDNPAWSQRVQSILVDIGFDPGLVADSVGKFLNRQPLNSTEADLIRSAIAYVGPPPLGQFSILPVVPTAVTSVPPPPAKKRWFTTGKFGIGKGHPVDYAWLQGIKAIYRSPTGWKFTGRYGLPKGHAVDYAYMKGIGLIQ